MATPYRPFTTSAGHFLSMQPAPAHRPDGDPWKPEEVWYRGDEVKAILDAEDVVATERGQQLALAAAHDKLIERSVGAMAIAEGDEGYEKIPIDCPMLDAVFKARTRIVELEAQLKAATERKPPKRASPR